MSRGGCNNLTDKEMWFYAYFQYLKALGRLLANKRNMTGRLSRKLITFTKLLLQGWRVLNHADFFVFPVAGRAQSRSNRYGRP